MFGEEKNLKNPVKDTSNMPAPYQAEGFGSGSYTKTDKLITALYMVTDIIDKDEPLRNKLRTLGTGIISDIHTTPANVCIKISEIMSFLDIAGAVNIISLMNCNILRKEFIELDQSIKESTNIIGTINKQVNLSEFFTKEISPNKFANRQNYQSLTVEQADIGHQRHTRIGVQKGHTLIKAIKDMSNKMSAPYEAGSFHSGSDMKSNTNRPNFDILKKERRDEIIQIIRNNPNGATITDIKTRAQGNLISCSEKTLQRELFSMVKDHVLNKTGEKRWSRYFLKTQALDD